jgi:hypothetical protein
MFSVRWQQGYSGYLGIFDFQLLPSWLPYYRVTGLWILTENFLTIPNRARLAQYSTALYMFIPGGSTPGSVGCFYMLIFSKVRQVGSYSGPAP